MNFDFSGKKVLVTGGGQGIGLEIVKKLVLLNAETYALGSTQEPLDALKVQCPSVTTLRCDVSDVDKTRAALIPHLPFHALVNNAGIQIPEEFFSVTPQTFDKILAVNLRAPLFISQTVARAMVDQKIKGSIVHVSSQASQMAIKLHTGYIASKAGLDGLCKSMAVELGQFGIRVNCVNPTVVMTAMGRKNWGEPSKAQPMLARIPLRRFAEIEDVVNAVLWLLSDFSAMTTGATIPVEGGAWAS